MILAGSRQVHGYRSGHQLLDASLMLERRDQDIIDRLSDIAGPLSPGERFAPYFTGYPLPSGKFYVLARTEQDLEAPRAGCVLTHSWIIDQSKWREDDPSNLINQLDSVPLKRRDLNFISNPVDVGPVPDVEAAILDELTEALFLEKRVPTVVFETKDASNITKRLMTALWPDWRTNFAFCTFSLSPRSVGNRPFDLLFAPKNARARFSEWPGRKLDARGSARGARHRWTSILEEKIFRSASPSLFLESDSPIRSKDGGIDESGLRLTLLWEELKQKVASTPTAALGLIDIAKSQSNLQSSWPTIAPFVERALASVATRLNAPQAWEFVTALGAKVGEVPTDENHSIALRSALSGLAKRDVFAAISFLAGETLADGPFRRSVYFALGEVIGECDIRTLAKALNELEPSKTLELLRYSTLLEEIFSRKAASIEIESIAWVQRGLSAADVQTKMQFLPYLLLHIHLSEHAGVLAELLAGLAASAVIAAIRTIWHEHMVRDAHLAETLSAAAISSSAKGEARLLFNSGGTDDATVLAVDNLLFPDEDDLRWILEADGIVGRDRAHFLHRLLGKASQSELAVAIANQKLRRECIGILLEEPQEHLASIFMLLSSEGDTDWSVQLLLYLLEQVSPVQRQLIKDEIFDRLNKSLPVGADVLVLALEVVAADIHPERVLALTREPDQLNAALIVFNSWRGQKRTKTVGAIADLVEAVVRKPRGFLSTNGAEALSQLLSEASRNRSTYLRACTAALNFAMGYPEEQISSLVVAAFPAVYEELKQESDSYGIFRLFSFIDWDKCKTARNELIETFMRSNWPPIDLAVSALRAKDIDVIFDKLSRDYRGREYISSMLNDLELLNAKENKAIKKAIYRVLE